MASSGPRYPGSVTTASLGSENAEDWVSPTNIGADDGSEASITAATFDSPDISFLLIGYNFGFAIPADATVDGMLVEIEKRDGGIGSAADNRVQIWVISQGAFGDNKWSGTDWPVNATVVSYGGASDTWNHTLTPAVVNDSNFGIALSVQATSANTDVFVDFIRVTIFYTPAASLDRRGVLSFAEFRVPDVAAEPPVAAFTVSRDGLLVSVTDASTDGDGSVVAWEWDFGDFTIPVTLQNPTHLYASPGRYTVTLTVTDNGGLQSQVSRQVTVRHGGSRASLRRLGSQFLG